MALACPVCQGEMEPIQFHSVKLDVCPQCAGIWFDSGELLALSKDSPEAMKELEDTYLPELEILSPAPLLKKCPRCGIVLHTHSYQYSTPIKIDSCEQCQGVFVEDQELEAIHQVIEDEDRARVTGAMQARSRLAGLAPPTNEGRDSQKDVSALIHALAHWRDKTSG